MNLIPNAHRRLLGVSLIAAFSLSSCMTESPYTGEQQVSKTTTGAGIGAATGALLGGIIGNNVGDSNAARGALIGAAIGGTKKALHRGVIPQIRFDMFDQ